MPWRQPDLLKTGVRSARAILWLMDLPDRQTSQALLMKEYQRQCLKTLPSDRTDRVRYPQRDSSHMTKYLHGARGGESPALCKARSVPGKYPRGSVEWTYVGPDPEEYASTLALTSAQVVIRTRWLFAELCDLVNLPRDYSDEKLLDLIKDREAEDVLKDRLLELGALGDDLTDAMTCCRWVRRLSAAR